MERLVAVVYIDVDEAPDAYSVTGKYRNEGESVQATVFIYRGDDEIAQFTVSGEKSDLDALAESIVKQAAVLAAKTEPPGS